MNKQQGAASIRRRLDRAISDSDWLRLFPQAMVHHLGLEGSDHVPILIKTVEEEVVSHWPFSFIQTWTINSSNFKVVKEVW